MPGTSGFQAVWASPSRSPSYRLLDVQRHRFGTGAWHLIHIHDLIALFTGISTRGEMVSDTF